MTDRALAILQILTAAGIAAFWLAFFTIGVAPVEPPAGYFVYQHAFPLPDSVMATMLAVGGVGRLRGAAWAPVISAAGAGGLVFLGFVDFAFNVENGLYTRSAANLAFTATQQLWCVGLGAAVVSRALPR